ncbi:hypothetical protein NLG97_g10145 [Lecanicillium saksenae]|uniref:Uncharacterized protein n=1 Tax=Lecanicillium saksenae TaxID=468837 RepID=A0ACC1QH17_9HYPO|nr:hypothetical protein NLG97_g10145 [Lecanicillium saksenae]
METSASCHTEDQRQPLITSLHDLVLMESFDTFTGARQGLTFLHITKDEEVYFGQSFRNKHEMKPEDFSAAMRLVPEAEIFPQIPTDTALTVAVENLESIFVKRTGLMVYQLRQGRSDTARCLLNETLIMEQISRSPHPNIVQYHGCRVRRGRITGIVLEKLPQTLATYATTPDFQHLDKVKVFAAVESAVHHLHTLGLAHNDISSLNIMMKEGGVPVLIDFDSCAAFGERLQSMGSPGWCEEAFHMSAKKHDLYSLKVLREWLETPKTHWEMAAKSKESLAKPGQLSDQP